MTSEHAGDDDEQDSALIVPASVSIEALEGGNGVLELVALTLRRGERGSELYAALKNVGKIPACSAALSVELFDRSGQSLASGISGLLTQRFYRTNDASYAIAACIAPADITMTAITDLPAELVIEDVGTVVYRCPYFALDVEPIAGLSLTDLERELHGADTAYSGTLRNGLDQMVRKPSVTVFPLNRVGRPLGAVLVSSEVEIAPHGSWHFETAAIAISAREYRAYPAGALEK